MATPPANDASATHPNDAESGPINGTRMSYGDHLEELRLCLIRALLGLGATTAIAFVFGRQLLGLILRPLLAVQVQSGLQPNIQALSPIAGFSAYLKISFLAGLILGMPWVIYQIWRFVASGLYAHERRFARALIVPSMLLFLLGVAFLYAVVLPLVLQFFISFNRQVGVPDLTFAWPVQAKQDAAAPAPKFLGDGPSVPKVPVYESPPSDARAGDFWLDASTRRLVFQTDEGPLSVPLEAGIARSALRSEFAIDYYLSFVLLLALAFGIAFETPVVVFFLAWSGILSARDMAGARKYVLLCAVILGAMLTPPDVISQICLALPIYLLFELGLLAGRLVERKSSHEPQ